MLNLDKTYITKKITRATKVNGTLHPVECYVEDEEMWVVQEKDELNNWWDVSEFFRIEDVKEFKIIK